MRQIDLTVLPNHSSLCEKINANVPQRRHCPVWHSRHLASIGLAEVSAQEFRISVLDDGCSDFAHQSEQVMHIVHSQSTQKNVKGQLPIHVLFWVGEKLPSR